MRRENERSNKNKNSSHWIVEQDKIKKLIHKREEDIAQMNRSMVLTEVFLQAIQQLMLEEKLPLQ